MASKYKSPSEVELVAICRLEFYKKQKNWKFCQDVCKKKATESTPVPKQIKRPVKSANSSKSILNKTYNLDEVAPSDLNNAFLEPDPDKIPPVTPPDPIDLPTFNNPHKNTSEPNILDQKWPEPHQQWPELQKQCPKSQQKWPESEQKWPEPEQLLPESEQQWPELEQQWPEVANNWQDANKVWSVPEMPEQSWQNVEQREWGGEEAYYPQDAETLRAYEMEGGWAEPCPEGNAFEDPIQPEAVLSAAEAWLRGAPRWSPNEETRSRSNDSVISFMRGAAAAPHSSEVDLNITEPDPQLSSSAAACLPARRLAAGLRAHAAALRTLLREARARAAIKQNHPPSLSVDYRTPNAFDLSQERPTRDIDLFQPHKDSFVAGSFKNSEPVGRGRGRLHRERLIGIGMGRPYRL